MPPPARQDTNEQKLRDAIHTATGLTVLADRWVFDTLLWTADFGTAFLPDRFQPRSLLQLAEKSFVSARQLKYSLDHLQRHGWLERHRVFSDTGIGGRGKPTRYVLCPRPVLRLQTGQPVPQLRRLKRALSAQETGQRLPAPAQVRCRFLLVGPWQGKKVGKAVSHGENEAGDYTGGPVSWSWPADSSGAAVNEP